MLRFIYGMVALRTGCWGVIKNISFHFMVAKLFFPRIKLDATKGYMWYTWLSLPRCDFFHLNAANKACFYSGKDLSWSISLGLCHGMRRWEGVGHPHVGHSLWPQKLLVAEEAGWGALHLLLFTLLFIFMVFYTNLGLCTNKTDFPVSI